MADITINQLPAASTIDAINDVLPIWNNGLSITQKINRNTLLGITGSPIGSTDSQSLSNKTLGNTNTVTLKDTLFTLQDDGDTTKQARFQLSGITTATTRTYTLPNVTDTLVSLTATQTLTNKTLTNPIINGGSIDQTTITVDSIAGHTASTTGTIYGITITSGVITGANTVNPTALATGIPATKFSVPYKFYAYRNASLTQPQNTIIVFDTEVYDTGTNFSTTTGLFTAPAAGFYKFDAMAQFVGGSGVAFNVSLQKNATGSLVTGDYVTPQNTGARRLAVVYHQG